MYRRRTHTHRQGLKKNHHINVRKVLYTYIIYEVYMANWISMPTTETCVLSAWLNTLNYTPCIRQQRSRWIFLLLTLYSYHHHHQQTLHHHHHSICMGQSQWLLLTHARAVPIRLPYNYGIFAHLVRLMWANMRKALRMLSDLVLRETRCLYRDDHVFYKVFYL